MTIKVIDLLKTIYEKKQPKRIMFRGNIYEWGYDTYTTLPKSTPDVQTNASLFNRFRTDYILNDEVEILDEPNKIEKLSWQQIGYKKYLGNGLETTRDIKEIVMDFNKQLDKSNNKLNEVIDKLNSLDKEKK